MKFISHMFSRANKFLQDETHLLLLWDGSLATLDSCVCKGNICGGVTAHFISRNRVSKSYSGKKAKPLSKTKTNESCFQLLKIVACTSPSAVQLEDWSTLQSVIAISLGRYRSNYYYYCYCYYYYYRKLDLNQKSIISKI